MSTPRTRVKRLPKRGQYDRSTIDAILDEAIVCHIGIEVDGQPYVIPSLHARVGTPSICTGRVRAARCGRLRVVRRAA